MRSSIRWIYEKRGLLLVMITCTATLWLYSTRQLNLYIHPRYNIFSLVFCTLGLCVALIAFKQGVHTEDSNRSPAAKTALGVCLVIVSVVSILLVRPATLTSSIANQRGLNNTATGESLSKLAAADVVSPFGNNSMTQLSVKDWSRLLSVTNDQAFFVDKKVSVTGFIVPDEADPVNYFHVSRFIVSCCAVDARPVGVPVHQNNWQASYKPDQWIAIDGIFKSQSNRLGIEPTTATVIERPKDPYVY